MTALRIGLGVDAHAFGEGVPLVLGGVRIEHPVGFVGHSDGDVVAHALTDALLGAAGLADIGYDRETGHVVVPQLTENKLAIVQVSAAQH